jgi:hypothetical protein
MATRCRGRQAEMGELTSELMCGTSDGRVGYEARPAPTPRCVHLVSVECHGTCS